MAFLRPAVVSLLAVCVLAACAPQAQVVPTDPTDGPSAPADADAPVEEVPAPPPPAETVTASPTVPPPPPQPALSGEDGKPYVALESATLPDGVALEVIAHGGCERSAPTGQGCPPPMQVATADVPDGWADALEGFDPDVDLVPLDATGNDAIAKGCDATVDGVDYSYAVRLADGQVIGFGSCGVDLHASGPLGHLIAVTWGT